MPNLVRSFVYSFSEITEVASQGMIETKNNISLIIISKVVFQTTNYFMYIEYIVSHTMLYLYHVYFTITIYYKIIEL